MGYSIRPNVLEPEMYTPYSGKHPMVHAIVLCLELGMHTSNADRILQPIEVRINKPHEP
jgi:hypothetical protein